MINKSDRTIIQAAFLGNSIAAGIGQPKVDKLDKLIRAYADCMAMTGAADIKYFRLRG